jgi:Fe-S cluster biogenesis protein NfuA
MTEKFDKKEFQRRLQKIEALIHTIESAADQNMRASAVELMQSLMELHGAGIERMMEIAYESGAPGGEIIDRLARDDLVESLLLLYGLHPLDIETRVTQALDKVRPYLRSHGGNVELIKIADGAVRLRLDGSCNGCASSAMTLKLAIEEAIYEFAPDVAALEVEGVVAQPAPSGLVQLGRAPGRNGSVADGYGWEDVNNLAAAPNGVVQNIEVSGHSVLFCRLGETLYAYNDVLRANDERRQA